MEVIIAIAIMALFTATFSSIANTALKISTSNRESLQSTIIAQNYLEDIRAARENNPNNLISRDNLRDWLNQSKDWLTSGENSVHFQNDINDSQSIVKAPDKTKGVPYKVKITYSIVEQDLYEYKVEVTEPNAGSCVLVTRLFIQI